jgi:signal transduction histidine kinase
VSDTGAVVSDQRPSGSWRRALEWWYRPVVTSRTWVALASLAVGMLWSFVIFVGALVSMTITIALCFAVVGVVLIVPTFALIDAMVGVERRRASWVGPPVPRRPLRTVPPGSSRRWIRGLTTRLVDPERWRQVGFIAAYAIVAPVLLALGLAPWVVLVGLVVGYASAPGSIDLLGLVAAVGFAGAAPRITIGVAGVARSFVAWFLGPDETAELQGRVDELAGQRTLILDAVAAERRRIERDLHDGVQQQLVALGIDIGRAKGRLGDDPGTAGELLDDALAKVRRAIGELRVIGRGLHPAVLEDRGLDAAVSAVVADAPIPITVETAPDLDVPDDVAATAYYVVSEAVANVLKHARARTASIRILETTDASGSRALQVAVHDDGRGGADPAGGTGLAGIRARVEGIDGSLRVDSPPGGPTTLVAMLPLRRPLPPPS